MRYRNKTLREKEKAFFIHYVKYETGNGDNMYKRTDMRRWTDMWGGGSWKCTCREVCGPVCVCMCVCMGVYECMCVPGCVCVSM